jgi:hypothetical protein
MKEYYFIGASLPELQVGYPPEISFIEFARLLRLNLSPEDLESSRVMRRYWDLQNLRSLWRGEKIAMRGNFNENELEDAVVTGMGFPGYVYEFLSKYLSKEERLAQFPELLITYYRMEGARATGFLKEYLEFERQWRLVFTGFRAKLLGKELAKELQFEDPDDDLIVQMMAQKDAKTYEPPARFDDLKGIFQEHGSSPLELEEAMCQWLFAKLEVMGGIDPFSLDRILSYQARLVVVEQWMELDKEKGLERVKRFEGAL